MLSLNITGALARHGYSKIPEEISDEVVYIATLQAYKKAVSSAPFDPEPDGVHIKEDLKYYYSQMAHMGTVWVRSPYANIAEYGSKHRLPHPYMRPASNAARSKMKQVIRTAAKKSAEKAAS